MPIKVMLNGANGRMGKAIQTYANPEILDICQLLDVGDDASNTISEVDLVIDFSHLDATKTLVKLAAAHNKAIVIGTTGHNSAERDEILSYSKKIPMVWSGNYSIGMNLLFHLTQLTATALSEQYEPEITEIHHHFKKDSPSGTAIDLARRICTGRNWKLEDVVQNGREGLIGERPKQQLGIHAIRGGDVVGEHTVKFFGEGERVELKHLATDRKVLAKGALTAAEWVAGKPAGFYEMQDVMGLR